MNKVTPFETFGLGVSFNLSQDLLRDKNVTAVLEEYFIQSDRITSPLTEAILITIYIIMSLSAIISNSLILKVILQTAKLYVPTYILLVNLMIADLALALVCMPFTLIIFIRQSWPFGWLMCKIIPMTQGVAVLATSLTIAMIATDRCLRITSMKPISLNQVSRKKCSRNKLTIEICLIWIVPVIIALPQALYQEQVEIGIPGTYSFYKCVEKWPGNSRAIYSLSVLFIQLIVPSTCLLISYFRIRMCLKKKFLRISESLVALNSYNNANGNVASNSALKGTPNATALADAAIIHDSDNNIPRAKKCGKITRNDLFSLKNQHNREQLYVRGDKCNQIIIDVVKSKLSKCHTKHSIDSNNDNSSSSGPESFDGSNNDFEHSHDDCPGNNNYQEDLNIPGHPETPKPGAIERDEMLREKKKGRKAIASCVLQGISLNLTGLDNDGSLRSYKLDGHDKGSPVNDIRADRIIREIYRNKRVTNTLLFVTATFAFGWIPWNLTNIYLDFSIQPVISADVIYSLMACCHILAMTSATVNAVLYGYTNCNIRRELRRFTTFNLSALSPPN